MKREIDEDIDLVGANGEGDLFIGEAGDVLPLVGEDRSR